MSTDKHQTLFPGALDNFDATAQVSSLPKNGIIPRETRGPVLKKRTAVPAYTPAKRPKYSHAIQREDPWKTYRAISKEDQAGGAIVAHKNVPSFPFVAVKVQVAPNSHSDKFPESRHPNITALIETFLFEQALSFVYEVVEISLSEVQSTPVEKFANFEIATVCKGLVHGLHHIHTTLDICHNAVAPSNVVFTRQGQVQLANIGHSLIQCKKTKNLDLKALASIVVELVDPSITAESRSKREFRVDSNESSQQIRDFIQVLDAQTAEVAMKHPFLALSPSTECLKPKIYLAGKWLDRFWESCE